MAKKQPWMIVLCGPNGAGKTTFYEKVLKDDPFFKKVDFINWDNVAARFAAEGANITRAYRSAGVIISNALDSKLQNHESFIYETTSAGRAHLGLIEDAQKNGFKIVSFFIGLSSPELSHLRVQSRVQNGGHSISAKDIERRFPLIMKNFPEMLKVSDYSVVFDNSGKSPFKPIFVMDQRQWFLFHRYPRWLGKLDIDRNVIRITKEKFTSMKPKKITNLIQRVFSQIDSAGRAI